MTRIASLIELAALDARARPDAVSSLFDLDLIEADPLRLDERGWADTAAVLDVEREAVERQRVVFVRDRITGREAVYNPLRGRRAARPAAAEAARDAGAGLRDCRWCDPARWHVSQSGHWAETFGDVYAAGGRICARPNWARQGPASGMVFGDERMHDVLRLGRDDFVGLFEAAERYLLAARSARSELDHFLVFLNGGQRAAASVEHAHLQVVGRPGRHFAWAEHVSAVAPADYWGRMRAAHDALGLAIHRPAVSAWATLVPAKERDVTAVSGSLVDGAAVLHEVLQALVHHGSNSFSLAAVLAPGYPAPLARGARFAGWPPVVWRLVDRGDRAARHGDIGCMELFGTTVVATDPFTVAGWLRGVERP